MPATPETPTQTLPPVSPVDPLYPATVPPFGLPPGETTFTSAPSYARRLPEDESRSRMSWYVGGALIALILVVAALIATGILS
jgi:hypothetical protein